jgi:tetratricopeptide (TPR) repeat protein
LKIRPFSSLGYLFLGELYADMGQREKALKNLKKASEMFKEMRID